MTPPDTKSSHERFCNLCHRHRPCAELYVVEENSIMQCPECGLVFTARENISVATVEGLYSKEYFEGGVPDGYTDYSASEETLRQQAQRLLARVRRHQPSGALLELGCAYGFFLLEAQQFFETE